MKKLLIALTIPLLFIAQLAIGQAQTLYKVTSIPVMKTYSGTATRIYVISTNADYIQCTTCTADETTVYAGAGGRKWLKFTDAVKLNIVDTTGKWLTRVYRKAGTDSVFTVTGATSTYAYRDSSGTSGVNGTLTVLTATNNTGQTWTITNPTSTPNLALALTSAAVGLSNANNTSDVNKPISTATQTALDLKVTYVDDLTALIAYSGASTVVIVRDSSTGGTFNYKTSGYTVDGGVVIAATGKGGGTKSWLRVAGKRVNPKWWGALGDGINDDGPLMQKAVDYCVSIGGGTVVFPRGTFRDTLPVYWASKVNIDGEGDQSIIYNNRVEDVNTAGTKYLPIYFGNYQPQSFDSTQSRFFNATTITGNRITLTTNSDLDSFSRGQIIIVRSQSGWFSKDDVSRPFKPYVVRINRVDSILAPNIIVTEDAIDTTLTPGKVAINGHFVSGASKATDENHHATYFISDIDVRNVQLKSKGQWNLRMSIYKANWQNLLLYGAEGISANAMAYHTWTNIRSFFWKQFSESSIGTHNTTMQNIQATWVNNSFLADASKPIIRFGENAHKVTISNINIDAGASTQRGIRANDATNCTIDGLTITGRNLSTYGIRLETGDDTDLVSNIIIKNSTFILGSTNRYVDMDKGGFTNSVLSDNIIEGNRFLGAVNTSVKLDGTNPLIKNNYFQSGDMAVNTLPVNGYVVGNYMATPTQTLTNTTFRNNYSGSVYPSNTTGTLTTLTATNNTGQTWTITNPTSTPNLSIVLTSASVGLSNADNTSDINKPVSTAAQTALNLKVNISDTAAMMSPYLRSALLSNVNNTSDANKPVSTATQTALNLKLNISDSAAMLSPYLRSALLSNVNNTSDANKPVSTATQTALNLKLNISDTAAMQANDLRSGSIAWPGTIYSTPTIGTVSGHAITYSPTLATQVANTTLAGPTTGSDAAPTFRALVSADIPSLSAIYGTVASPTFTGTVTLPTPFTIGAVSMTSTGTQLNYLNVASGLTGTGSVVLSAAPSFTGGISVAGNSTINGSLTINTTSLILRTTNGGGNLTATGMVDMGNSNSTAGSLGVAWENTTGWEHFTAANGTRRISRAYIGIANLVNTANSESADFVIGTQAGGAAATEKLRISSAGLWSLSTTAGTANQIVGVNNAGTAMEFKTVSTSTTAVSSDIGVTLSGANALVINIPSAATGVRGVLSTGTQSVDGAKTWNSLASFANGVTITTSNFINAAGSMRLYYLAKTANYTITVNDFFIDCTSNSFTITLPTAVSVAGRVYIIKNSGTATTITMATASSQTIDGAAPLTITTATPLRVMSDGANWKTW